MKEVYEIISCIDRALGESVEADFSDYPAQGAVMETLQESHPQSHCEAGGNGVNGWLPDITGLIGGGI